MFGYERALPTQKHHGLPVSFCHVEVGPDLIQNSTSLEEPIGSSLRFWAYDKDDEPFLIPPLGHQRVPIPNGLSDTVFVSVCILKQRHHEL